MLQSWYYICEKRKPHPLQWQNLHLLKTMKIIKWTDRWYGKPMNWEPQKLPLHWWRQNKPLHGQQGKYWVTEHVISTIVHPLPLNVCCESRKSYHRPPLCGPLSQLLLHCMSLEPHEESVAQCLDITDGCIWQKGKQNQLTLAHFDTNILTHASACIQMHSQTQCHSNMLLYICTVYSLCIVSDAVICMLICRWSVTIIH